MKELIYNKNNQDEQKDNLCKTKKGESSNRRRDKAGNDITWEKE